MQQLVVLVGPAGSGKTTFQKQYPEWAVVSKDDIRRTIFHRDFDLDYENTVERIFAATLVEAVDSPAQVVCVDNTNLTRSERQALIEVAQLSDRKPIVYIMPKLPFEEMYERKQQQLNQLAQDHRHIQVNGFPRERYERIYQRYEEVEGDEGFAKVMHVASVPVPPSRKTKRVRKARRTRTRGITELKPLPLFAQ